MGYRDIMVPSYSWLWELLHVQMCFCVPTHVHECVQDSDISMVCASSWVPPFPPRRLLPSQAAWAPKT